MGTCGAFKGFSHSAVQASRGHTRHGRPAAQSRGRHVIADWKAGSRSLFSAAAWRVCSVARVLSVVLLGLIGTSDSSKPPPPTRCVEGARSCGEGWALVLDEGATQLLFFIHLLSHLVPFVVHQYHPAPNTNGSPPPPTHTPYPPRRASMPLHSQRERENPPPCPPRRASMPPHSVLTRTGVGGRSGWKGAGLE